MTCREKLKMEHPEKVDPKHRGGCSGCPSGYYYLPDPPECNDTPDYCTKCWDREIPGTEDPKIDIHKIIDEAMEKRDRYVTIYIGQGCTTINVYPWEKKEPARWEYNEHHNNYTYNFECSACGGESDFASEYCPRCGEQMKMPKEEKTDE